MSPDPQLATCPRCGFDGRQANLWRAGILVRFCPDPWHDARPVGVPKPEAPLTIHPPSYLAGWNDAKAGRQYGEGRGQPEGPPSPTPSLPRCPACSSPNIGFSLTLGGDYQGSRCLDCDHGWDLAASRPDVAPQPEEQ